MPLLDHFHEPLVSTHSWPSFHAGWAVALMRALNRTLSLPLLPLALRGAFFVPIDLEATYTETRESSRL